MLLARHARLLSDFEAAHVTGQIITSDCSASDLFAIIEDQGVR